MNTATPPIAASTAASATPGQTHRPLQVADILDRAVGLYRAHFLAFAVIPLLPSGVYLVATQVLQMAMGPVDIFGAAVDEMETGKVLALQGAQMWIVALGYFVNLWAAAALVHAISRRYMGLDVTWPEAMKNGLDRVPYLAVTSFVLVLAMMASMFFLMLPTLFLAFSPSLVLGVVAYALSIIPAVGALLVVLWLWLHGAAVVIEGRGVRDALERSRALMRRRVGGGFMGRNDLRLSLFALVLPAIALSLSMLAMVPSGIVAVLGGMADWLDFTDPEALVTLLQGPLVAAQLVGNSLYQPFAIAVTVIFYYDIRYRTEGLDLELRGLEIAHAGATRSRPA